MGQLRRGKTVARREKSRLAVLSGLLRLRLPPGGGRDRAEGAGASDRLAGGTAPGGGGAERRRRHQVTRQCQFEKT